MTDPNTVYLFSYGTLRLERLQMASFGRLLEGRGDAMPHFRKDAVEIEDPEVIRTSGERFHSIVRASDDMSDEVEGTLFRITSEELAAADRYEVSDYTRIEVILKSGTVAWVYVKAREGRTRMEM